MKKFTNVSVLVALTTLLTLAGCSSAEVEPDAQVEPGANTAEFNALANPDGAAAASAEASPGAVVDSASQPTTVADNSAYSPPSFTDSAPAEKSPVNLGASSAGRAH